MEETKRWKGSYIKQVSKSEERDRHKEREIDRDRDRERERETYRDIRQMRREKICRDITERRE